MLLRFPLSFPFKSFIMMCPGMSPFLLFYLELVELLGCADYFFKSNMGHFQKLFFKYSFCSFPFFLAYIGTLTGDTEVSEALYIFVHFPFSSSDWIISVDLSSSYVTFSPACSNMLLGLSSEFFMAVVMLFNSRIYICFFLKKNKFYLLSFSIWWDDILKLFLSSLLSSL